jgi:hypothetical protein
MEGPPKKLSVAGRKVQDEFFKWVEKNHPGERLEPPIGESLVVPAAR